MLSPVALVFRFAVNSASNYLFICFGAPALNLPPVDASCHILDISGVYPSNVTLLPTTVLTGTPPKPRILSSFTTKIPYENSVMFGFGGFDGENYLEDLFAIDTSDLPKQASWIPVQPTPQYQNPKRYRPGPRADYGRFIPLPLPVQTQGLPQPQLLWGGSGTFNASKANKGSSTVAPMLPNVTDSLGTMFALDPETWGWTAAFPVPSTGDQISLWQQPSWKWIIAGVCLGVTAVIAMMMLCVCLFRGGLKDPAVPLWGRCWRVHLDDDEDDIYGKARSEKYPKVGLGMVLADGTLIQVG